MGRDHQTPIAQFVPISNIYSVLELGQMLVLELIYQTAGRKENLFYFLLPSQKLLICIKGL